MLHFMRTLTRARPGPRSPVVRRAFPRLEALESRLVPYATSGDAWPVPQLITLSFVPDGTNLGGVTSNLFATFNAKWATSTWENQILKAAQVWAQQTNINFSVISDSGADEGSGNYQQGNPTIGDIRISGFNFGTSGLGQALLPPPVNNYSIAGDISFNTGQSFSIGPGGYDLFTVAAHEIGHAMGLLHTTVPSAVMYSIYNGQKTGLNSDDTNGIRNIYSSNNARSYDAFNGANNSFSTAANLTGLIDANGTVLETGLNIATTSLKEYFTITAPSNTNGTMSVTVQSQGLSLLAPTLTVYNSSQTQIAYVSGAGQYGTTLTRTITGVSPGQQFYVKVGGADSTSFGTGNYAMTFAFAGIAPPPVPLPNTQVLNGNPLQGGGSVYLGSNNVFTHGAGCNCPMCRGAVASVQQQQVSMPVIQMENENSTSTVSHVQMLHVDALDSPASQAVTQVFVFVPLPQAAAVPALAVEEVDAALPMESLSAAPAMAVIGSASIANDEGDVSWSQACQACFISEAGTDDAASDGSVSAQAEALTTLIEPAAAAGMLLLGSYWGAHPAQPDQPARRRLAL